MRKFQILLVLFLISTTIFGQVGINTENPDPSASLTVAPNDRLIPSNYKGTLLSAMTSAQRTSIASPATGLIVYDTDKKCLMTNNGTPAIPDWQCVGGNNDNGNGGMVYSKHFHYALPADIPTSTSDFSGRDGAINTVSQTLLSNWLTTNDPSQVAELPSVSGMRMDIVFYNKGTSGAVYRPLIVNTNAIAYSLNGVTRADISGLYQWDVPTNFPANGYLNVDSDRILGWSHQGYQEVSVSTFRIAGDEGSLYRATYFGNRINGKHNIHLILEKFGPQNGGVHN